MKVLGEGTDMRTGLTHASTRTRSTVPNVFISTPLALVHCTDCTQRGAEVHENSRAENSRTSISSFRGLAIVESCTGFYSIVHLRSAAVLVRVHCTYHLRFGGFPNLLSRKEQSVHVIRLSEMARIERLMIRI